MTYEEQTGAQIARLESQVQALRVRLAGLCDAAEVAILACEPMIGRPLINGPLSQDERDADAALMRLRAWCKQAWEVL